MKTDDKKGDSYSKIVIHLQIRTDYVIRQSQQSKPHPLTTRLIHPHLSAHRSRCQKQIVRPRQHQLSVPKQHLPRVPLHH